MNVIALFKKILVRSFHMNKINIVSTQSTSYDHHMFMLNYSCVMFLLQIFFVLIINKKKLTQMY